MKISAIILVLGLMLLLTACAGDDTGDAVSDASSTEAVSTASTESTESAEETSTVPDVTSSEPEVTAPPEQPVQTNTSKATGGDKQTPTSKAPDPKKNDPPVTPKPPATTSAPPPTTSTKPPTDPSKPTFNAQPYFEYAKSYGISIGLKYEPQIGTGAWNAPTNLYDGLTDNDMKRNIRGACDRLTLEGFEYFYLEVKSSGKDSYQLYVYYS